MICGFVMLSVSAEEIENFFFFYRTYTTSQNFGISKISKWF